MTVFCISDFSLVDKNITECVEHIAFKINLLMIKVFCCKLEGFLVFPVSLLCEYEYESPL